MSEIITGKTEGMGKYIRLHFDKQTINNLTFNFT